MALFFSILLWIGIILGSFILILLIFPFHIDGKGVLSDQVIMASFRMRWAFGLIAVKGDTQKGAYLYLLGIRVVRLKADESKDEKKPKKEKKKKPKKEKKKDKDKRSAPFSSWLVWFKRNYRTMLKSIKQIFGLFHLKGKISGNVGLGDPADMAMIDIVRRYFYSPESSFQVDIWPNYLDEEIDLTFQGSAWVVFIQFLFLPVSWLIRKDTRRMLFRIPRAQKIQKQ